MIDGTRIRALIERAQHEPELRLKLFHCPEKAILGEGLTDDEARAVRAGDLSSVDLDDETLAIGRKLFTELPPLEGQHRGAAQHLIFSSAAIQQLCA